MKPQGFRKFGRTLHRFVSEDISQVINFQVGSPTGSMKGYMCVNIGLRIPEVAENTFHPQTNKKYYSESSCTFRKRLDGEVGSVTDVSWFDLTKDTQKIIADIIRQIEDKVMPSFDVMCNREAILEPGKENMFFNSLPFHNCTLTEALIYGYLGNIEKAKEIFEVYYQKIVNEYNDKMTNGAKHGYIDTLDKLAVKLGLR